MGSGGKTTYYYCSRSGFFRNTSTDKRYSKLQGTDKLNAHCTAAITLTELNYKTTNHLQVQVYKTHYGHKCSLGHIRLPYSHREAIAGRLSQGVTIEHILDSIRDNVGDSFERIHLTSRKDIRNIERAFGLKGDRRHDDDATSVELWVNEMNDKGDESPVLIYKPQG